MSSRRDDWLMARARERSLRRRRWIVGGLLGAMLFTLLIPVAQILF